MSFGEILRELLEQHNITQKELAVKLAITPSALGNYVQGTREPDFNTLIKIASFFRVSTDFLLGYDFFKRELSHKEELLLHIFRSLTEDQQEFYLEQGKIFIKQNNKKTSYPFIDKNKETDVG